MGQVTCIASPILVGLANKYTPSMSKGREVLFVTQQGMLIGGQWAVGPAVRAGTPEEEEGRVGHW